MEWWIAFLAALHEFGAIFYDSNFWIFMAIVVPPYMAAVAYFLIKYSKEDRFMRVLSLPENVSSLVTEFSKDITVVIANTHLTEKYTVKNVNHIHIMRNCVNLLCSDSSFQSFGFTEGYCNVAEDEGVLSIRVDEFVPKVA
jgi:hypothetical protein